MALSLAEIRAKLQAQEEKAQNPTQAYSNEPNAFLAHWLIDEGKALNLRFLPDANEANPYFWKERDMITLTFNGIKGGDNKPTRVTVPCNEMWGPTNSCPVLKDVREWFKAGDPALEERARAYWKKKSYLLQCIIAPDSTTVDGDVAPENPIRRVMLSKSIFNKVKSILMNPRVEYMPTDYDHGRDFSIIKGKQGQFANYDQSMFDMYERPLNADEQAAIEKYGLFDLEEFMPKQPTPEQLQAIAEMFEASVNEEQYDPERWAQYYRPAGVQAPQGGTTTQAPVSTPATESVQQAPVSAPTAPVTEPVVEQKAPVAQTTTSTAAPAMKSSTSDLLAKLKASKK